MSKYDLEVKKLDKMINDLEALLAAGFDPTFNEMLKHFRVLREKYRRLSDTGYNIKYGNRNRPYWSNSSPDG